MVTFTQVRHVTVAVTGCKSPKALLDVVDPSRFNWHDIKFVLLERRKKKKNIIHF